ncbi:MAG: biotin/lipoyl-binding protein, partial [Parvibaculum sedimenti]|uniref:biotin/lipoyl-binding protein n=1 Tax=Parvibaculum sedimenti TaxID=2608632 RepID=UPI003BB7C0EE
MQSAPLPVRVAITTIVLLFAVFAGYHLWSYYMSEPWTRDGRVSADVVEVAPDVSGLVVQVSVVDNQYVRAGDPLFTIDAERFRLALDEAAANVENRKAQMEQFERDAVRKRGLRDDA